ncbi:MAG: helicase [Flavobacterium psychrophilum]|nr:MAG: helicase [Flavobacterium psychrophilum]
MEELLNFVNQSEELNFDQSFDLAQTCSSLLEDNENDGRKLVIHILHNWNKLHESTHEIWTDLVEASGFYPYLEKYKDRFKFSNISGQLRKELHVSENLENKYLHDEQFELLKLLNGDKNVIVSAPTSFGKSLLIEEIVASLMFKNIVVIQPTLALLDETRKKLLKYNKSYKLIVRTSQEASRDKGNIFLFTAERVNEYQDFPFVDFLVIDEFYKLSGKRDDERSSSLNNAFHYMLKKFSPKFYLLGPNIDSISQGFEEKYNAIFFKSNYSLVDSNEVNIYQEYIGEFGDTGNKKIYKEKVLFDLLISLQQEQTLIYCSSPNRVRDLSKKFSNYLTGRVSTPSNDYPLAEWINDNVAEDWSVLKNLKNNIGIHDGALQKHITTSIIDYFNQGKLKYLFCTSTIIEGVNTSAKNIIYFDRHKGLKLNGRPKEIDFFDYSNIKGRAGRMMEHFVGKIYNFNKPPENENIIIDIPFFQQNPIKDEILIHLESDEIIDSSSEQINAIRAIPESEREIIKRNGVKVHGQKTIIDVLRNDINTDYELFAWNQFPTYPQLSYVLGLAWDHLIVEGESTKPMSKKKLIFMTFNYGIHRSINKLIQEDLDYKNKQPKFSSWTESDIRDQSIQETFQVMKHWFEYKVPKWLSVINELQKFVCYERGFRAGNYVYYANLIENDFVRENLAILSEFGVPSSAVRKIQDRIPITLSQDDVLQYIRERKLYELNSLLQYEKEKLRQNLNI